MSGKPLGAKIRADQAAHMAAYKAARDEGLDTYAAAERAGIGDQTRAKYERWYRRQNGLPDRERGWQPRTAGRE